MADFVLTATERTSVGKKNKKLRAAGKIPAVLYGVGAKNRNLELSKGEFEKVYAAAGESTLVDLVIQNEKPVKTLIHDFQMDPVKNDYLHVDFYQVNMKEKIRAELALHFTGEAPAVKEFGGVLVKNLTKLHIECLPGDLIGRFDVDLSALKDLTSIIHVSDLKLPAEITVKNDPHEIIARVTVIKEETPVAAEAAPVSAADVPVVEKEKKAEEGEGAEAGKEAPAAPSSAGEGKASAKK